MAIYSIKDLEKISGIKAHTIRIWERRYGLVEPSRTNTNIRYYSDADLKKLLNISILNQNGFKISKIAKLDDQQLRDRVLDLCIDAGNNNVQVESLMVSMLELDERKFLNVLSGAIINNGFEGTVEKVLFPFLERVGMLWQAGTINPAQEHFISNLVRQKIIVAIDNEMQNINVNGPRIIFFLPEDELHEIGLLFYSLLARKEGLDVVYLGMTVPLADLKLVQQVRPADVFFTSFVSARDKGRLEASLELLRNYFPYTPVWVNGLQIKELNPRLPYDFSVISSGKDFRESVKLLKYGE